MTNPACATCVAFDASPAGLERALPGLAALSSAHAATRTQDGHCLLHHRLVTRHASCARHIPTCPPA